MSKKYKYIVKLEDKCWIAPWDGDPGRTVVKTNAQKFDTLTKAKIALRQALRYRSFGNPEIIIVEV